MTSETRARLEQALAAGPTETPWAREDNTIYTLEHVGWHRGKEVYGNRIYAQFNGSCSQGASEEVAASVAYFQAVQPANVRTLLDEHDAAIGSLRAQLVAAERDAARYRWIRRSPAKHSDDFQPAAMVLSLNSWGNINYRILGGKRLDAAIDAALSATQPQGDKHGS